MVEFVDSFGEEFMAEAGVPEGTAPETKPEAPEPEPSPQPEPEAPQGGHIPIQALLDEREKRQEAARRAEALERQLAQIQQAQQAQGQPRPDLYDDPEAWAAQQQQQLAEQLWNQGREISARFAIKEHGKETLDAAVAWAQAKNDPYLHQRFRASSDPYNEVIVPEYQRDQLLSKIGSDPDAFVRQRYAELTAGSQTTQQAAQAAQTQQPASKPAVRPSLAAQTGAGSGPSPVEAGFDSLVFPLDRKR